MPTASQVLKKIKGVQIVKPSDHVISQFRELIANNVLKPGDVLPSERELANSFGIGRGYIREAIKTLELYGVFRSVSGVGTIVEDLGIQSINEFINNLVNFGVHDYVELVEVRSVIEPYVASRAAVNATDQELESLGVIVDQLDAVISNGDINLELEVRFHLELAKASHNRIFANTISAILPGLVKLLDELDLTTYDRLSSSREEHREIFDTLIKRNPKAAKRAMQLHMENAAKHFNIRITEITEERRASQRLTARTDG